MDRRNFIEVGRVLVDLISQTGGYLPEPVDEARFPQLAADIRGSRSASDSGGGGSGGGGGGGSGEGDG